MEDKSNISIFQGSTVEADTVHDFLAQQNIGSLVRNHMQENLDAGWVTAASEHAAEVFVAREDQTRAVELLRNLFHEDNTTAGETVSTHRTSVTPEIPVIIKTPIASSSETDLPRQTPPPTV